MGTAEDKLEIMELYSRYSYAVDGPDMGAVADVFTEDGVFAAVTRDGSEMAIRGHEALLNAAKASAAVRIARQRRHNQGCPLITDLTPECAKARTYLVLISIAREPGSVHTIDSTGVYEDDLVRTPQGWRFKKRRFVADPQPPPEAPSQY